MDVSLVSCAKACSKRSLAQGRSNVPLFAAAMAKRRASSGQPSAAKASRRRSVPATEQLDAIDQPDQPDATELARAFGVDAKAAKGVRTQDQLFSLVDVTMLVTGEDCNYAAQQIRFLREHYLEVNEKYLRLMKKSLTSNSLVAGSVARPPGTSTSQSS